MATPIGAIRTTSFGWSTVYSDPSPSHTPTELATISTLGVKLEAEQPTKPYEFIDGATRGFAAALIYCGEIDLLPNTFPFTASGILASRKLDVWCMNDPKFMQSTDPNWTDRLGTGWVRVTLQGKYELVRQGGVSHYKLQIKAASPLLLTES